MVKLYPVNIEILKTEKIGGQYRIEFRAFFCGHIGKTKFHDSFIHFTWAKTKKEAMAHIDWYAQRKMLNMIEHSILSELKPTEEVQAVS